MATYLPLALICAAFVLHVLGERRAVVLTGRPRSRQARQRAMCFYAGLATIGVTLVTPIESYSQKLLWVHMIEHMLMLSVAAPLIVLGRPWMSLWRPLPLGFRRATARAVYRSPRFAWLRALGRWAGRPLGAWVIFIAGLLIWHWPVAYDLALRNSWVHALEHITFITCAILFWAQVLALPPAEGRMTLLQRAGYVFLGSIPNAVLGAVLSLSETPFYSYYVHLLNRPGGFSAVADQQIAGGIMWAAGDIPFGIAIVWLMYQWLSDYEARAREREAVGGVG